MAATIPVAAGIVLEGVPPPLVLAGIAMAVVAVVLVSRVSDEGSGPSGIGLALLAGGAIGAMSICISQLSDGHVFGPLTLIRLTQAVVIVAFVLVTRSAWRVERRLIRRLPRSECSTWPATACSSSPSKRARWPSRPSCRRSTR
jgi:drug/metabolite transporter (DMT)-like permease